MAVETYEQWLARVLPPWLLGEWGSRYVVAIGGLLDTLVAGAKEAAKAGFVGLAPVDAVPRHGYDRWLPRIPGETDEAWRERLLASWDTLSGIGPRSGFIDLLEAYMGCTVRVFDVSVDRWPNGTQTTQDDNNLDNWSRFWVVFGSDHPWERPVMGADAIGPGGLIGITMTETERSLLRRVVQEYRPAHMVPVEAWITFDLADPSDLLLDHTASSDYIRIPLRASHINYPSAPTIGGGTIIGQAYH